MNPTRFRTPILALGIAASGFLFSATDAQAGAKEKAAINAQIAIIAPGKTLADATSADIVAAVRAAIELPANKKMSAAVLVGEALKGAGATAATIGVDLGTSLSSNPTPRVSALGGAKLAAGAAVTASTGAAPSAEDVPSFAQFFVTSTTDTISVAKLAVKSNTAIGAIVAGRGLEETDANLDDLAGAAITDKKLKKAAQQISQYVGGLADNAPVFARDVALKPGLLGLTQKIATGVATSNPNQADAIVDALIDTSDITKAQVLKIAPKLAKAVGTAGSIEQVQLLAETFGKVVSTKQVNGTAKSLAQAIASRAYTTTGENRIQNKADEMGEAIAYFVASLENNNAALDATFADPKKAATLVFNIAKTMFKAAKVKNVKGLQTPTALQALLASSTQPGNFAASLAYTLTQLGLPDPVFQAIKAKLISNSAAAIGGKKNKTNLVNGFNAGFAGPGTVVGDPFSGYENGNAVGSVLDPETDIRNS